MFYEKNKRHFRNLKTMKKGKHPNYVVGEEKKNYLSFGLTPEQKLIIKSLIESFKASNKNKKV